ncbi:MAG TPA: DNA polymerase III subunit delta' [Caulobacteraceae bacterium]|jgi:DNA polymerase-3 subunit delta'|nr:DNA polymerase III subunit delta' [Caulobacteraceae bacterium]
MESGRGEGGALTDIPHPRETFEWIGPAAPEDAFADALDRGRLHHAWLVTGPSGVGKATFAYRAARRLLGAPPDDQWGRLGASADDPVSRRIAVRAAPDLLVLQTQPEDGKTRRFIPAEEAREVAGFFSKSPAAAPFRVAIIDSADDLNTHAANAVLKILEEPPSRGVIFLLSSSPGGLLATIRSRCRRLAISPPPRPQAVQWLTERAGTSADQAEILLDMARGAPGGGWRLAEAGALDADRAAAELLDSIGKPDAGKLQSLADGFRGAAGASRFSLVLDRLADHVRRRAAAEVDPSRAARLAEAWTALVEAPGRADAINLDRGEVFLNVLSRLRAIA